VRNVPIGLARRSLIAGITSPLSNWIFHGEIPNISQLSWMTIMDKYLINTSLGYGREGIGNDTETLAAKNERQI
jgi:hypothetical protein